MIRPGVRRPGRTGLGTVRFGLGMVRLGLRLAVAGGREALTRLVVIAAAVALGAGMLLATLAGAHAVDAQNARYAWLDSGTAPAAGSPAVPSGGRLTVGSAPLRPLAAADPLWWLHRVDYVDGEPIRRVDVAGTGPDSPVPPGLPRVPGPGEFYASPALAALLASVPADQLADRYPGRQVGTLGPAALPDPESLVIVIGRHPEQLASLPDAVPVTGINTAVLGSRAAALDLVLSVVAGGLLFPVLIFIATATRLTAARREQRFAAIRLSGGTSRQVAVLAAVEAALAAVAGTAAGFGLFLLVRPWLAGIPFTGVPFYPADLAVGPVGVALVGFGVPAGAAVAAMLALRRVRLSPLGVARRVPARPPRAYRLIPLLLGIGELTFFALGPRPGTSDGQVAAFLPGFLLVLVGLVVAGPWLTLVGARLLARRSRRPAPLLAARRLADHPQAGFRAVSGLVLALFVTSVAVGTITTIVANRGPDRDGAGDPTLFASQPAGPGADPARSIATATTADLLATPGVRSVTEVRANPAYPDAAGARPGLVACADLARVPAAGRCEPGAEVAAVWPNPFGSDPTAVWPAAPVTVDELRQLPLESIVVRTDGSTAATERARTILEVAYPASRRPPIAGLEFEAEFTRILTGWQQLANVVILASLAIAGCSLAASVIGGVSERKRPFSLLRLAGAPLRVLRRALLLESAVPLLAAAVVAVGTGFLSAALFLQAQMDYSLRSPGVAYYLLVLTGLAASLGIVAGTLPLLERVTGPETARNE